MPSPGYRVSGKEVEVRDSGSRHHRLCSCCNLQLIQSHVAPSHGPTARVLSPLFLPAKSLLLPKPCGKKKHSKTTWSSPLSFRTVWSFSPFQNLVVLLFYFRTTWTFIYLLASEPRGSTLSFRAAWSPPFSPKTLWSSPLWMPGLGLNPSAHLPLQPHS